jgi:translation elongation factor EF-1alpha
MAKFLIQSVFALAKNSKNEAETILAGIVQEGRITIGMKSNDLELMEVKSIEQFNKKITQANAGMNIGLHVNRLKKMATESMLFNKLIEFN